MDYSVGCCVLEIFKPAHVIGTMVTVQMAVRAGSMVLHAIRDVAIVKTNRVIRKLACAHLGALMGSLVKNVTSLANLLAKCVIGGLAVVQMGVRMVTMGQHVTRCVLMSVKTESVVQRLVMVVTKVIMEIHVSWPVLVAVSTIHVIRQQETATVAV